MDEYTWSISETEKMAKRIPDDCVPARFALTAAVAVRQVKEGVHSILLCNPHPDSWNNWLLPFGALVLDRANVFQPTPTFQDMSSYLASLRRENEKQYVLTVGERISRMLGVEEIILKGEPFLENFSLKYSKTANVWTAYLFSYYIAPISLDRQPECPTIWLPLEEETIELVTRQQRYSNLPVADNVLTLLADRDSVGLICR